MAEETPQNRHHALFVTLIQQYQMQAWVSLGKLKNPVTDKIERNVELAGMSIDMLEMIKEKTRGNITEDERRFLEQTLSDLRLNYVEESGGKGTGEQEDSPAGEKQSQAKEESRGTSSRQTGKK